MSLILPEKRQRQPPDFVKGRRAVIDGDRYPYMIGFAAQENHHAVTVIGEDSPRATFTHKKPLKEWLKQKGLELSDVTIETTIVPDKIENCLHSVKLALQGAIEGSRAETYQVYIGGETNFRDDLATISIYKGTRSQDKPIFYEQIREYMINHWNAIVVEGWEADDQLAMEATKDPENTIVVSDDKDLNTVPCLRYIPGKDVLFRVSEQDALLWFYSQCVIGDPIDGIIGIPGSGKMAAYNALKDCDSEMDMYISVWNVYHRYIDNISHVAAGLNDANEMLLENARLLWMVRETDENNQPVMWQPPE